MKYSLDDWTPVSEPPLVKMGVIACDGDDVFEAYWDGTKFVCGEWFEVILDYWMPQPPSFYELTTIKERNEQYND